MRKGNFIFIVLIFIFSSCHVARFIKRIPDRYNDGNSFSSRIIKNNPASSFSFPTIPESSRHQLMDSVLRFRYTDTNALIIIRNDSLLYEYYREENTDATKFTSFSIAKSFVSALVGIAIEEGYILSEDEPITNYLKGLRPEFENITIRHLLNMRSGIKYQENYINPFGQMSKLYYGTNISKNLGRLKIAGRPGGEFNYQSINTQLLGLILEQATNTNISDYLSEKIWKPLGMSSEAFWSIDSKKNGKEKAFCCLIAEAKDYAKFGRLYLNNGRWEGNQIIPKEWIEKSTIINGSKNFGYANQWWQLDKFSFFTESKNIDTTGTAFYYNRYNFGNRWKYVKDSLDTKNPFARFFTFYNKKGERGFIPRGKTVLVLAEPTDCYYAQGYLGQYVFINPKTNTIIVRLGKSNGPLLWENYMYFLSL